jgi:anti-sigma28 factor (negative regulator of flagellin synthesis)
MNSQKKRNANVSTYLKDNYQTSKTDMIRRLTKEIAYIPEIRIVKVIAIKSAIQKGIYQIKGELVASKMLQEMILDEIVHTS